FILKTLTSIRLAICKTNFRLSLGAFLTLCNFLKKYILEIASLANGCFWCSDAVFRKLKGIGTVESGFMGVHIKNPAYRDVVQELTGHAECIQFEFNPEKISYRDILLVFFTTHDPTSLNRQGYDVGTHYRSAIFYHSEQQKETALQLIRELNDEVYEG